MISLRRRDNIGNCLFEYCFARILAERFGYRLEAVPLGGFPGTRTPVAGEEVLGPVALWDGMWPFEAHSGRPIAWEELHRASGARLTLHGAFQRFDLIADRREDIRNDWLRLDNAEPGRPAGDFAICLRFGGGPGEPGGMDGHTYSAEEVWRLVRTVRYERLHFVTDQPAHPLLAVLGELGAEVHLARGIEALRLVRTFQKVAIGQSVLGWWGAFLGEAREIYFPKIDRGRWSHPEPARFAYEPEHHGIDLRVLDEGRYIYDW